MTEVGRMQDLQDRIRKLGCIYTERLELIPWNDDDEDVRELFQLAKDVSVGPPAGWKPHSTIEESRSILRNILIAEAGFKIFLKREKITIGHVSLFKDNRREGVASAELGYWLGSRYWGCGYMTEAASALCDEGFSKKVGLDIIAAQCGSSNLRSAGVLKKIGFKKEGVLRRAYHIYTGEDRDCVVWSLLAKERIKL